MADYADDQLRQSVRLQQITRHMLGLYAGQSGARRWRRFLTEESRVAGNGAEILAESLKFLAASE